MIQVVFQRVVAWLVFGLFVWAFMAIKTKHKPDGEGRIRGPLFWAWYSLHAGWTAYRTRGHNTDDEDQDEEQDDDDQDEDDASRSEGRPVRMVTQRRATEGATATRQGATGPVGGDNRQVDGDRNRDRGATGDTTASLAGWRQRVATAFDLLFRPPPQHLEDVSGVAVAPPPAQPSPTVTPTGQEGMAGAPSAGGGSAAGGDDERPVRVIVHYVGPGSWTGQLESTAADGTRIIQRYQQASRLGAPTGEMFRHQSTTRPAPADPLGPARVSATVQEIGPVEQRRQWLRTLIGLGRFSDLEIAEMYREKWGLGQRSLQRDRAAALSADDHTEPADDAGEATHHGEGSQDTDDASR